MCKLIPLFQYASKDVCTLILSDDVNAGTKGQKEERKITPTIHFQPQDYNVQKIQTGNPLALIEDLIHLSQIWDCQMAEISYFKQRSPFMVSIWSLRGQNGRNKIK